MGGGEGRRNEGRVRKAKNERGGGGGVGKGGRYGC